LPPRGGPHKLTAASFAYASEILPWVTTNVSVSPFGSDWWSFNPSIHHDPRTGRWLCVFRCADYSLPGGVPKLSNASRPGRAETRNVVAAVNPSTWELGALVEIEERDGCPRAAGCASIGYEDMRLFRTERYGLCAIATALQLNIEHPNRPEMIFCQFNDDFAISSATPLRGAWSARPQKNWSPFDGADEPRFLYSIERGVVMGEDGPVDGSPPPTQPPAPRTFDMHKRGVEVKVTPRNVYSEQPKYAKAKIGSDDLRGGSQLARIGGDLWLGLAHEMTLTQPERRKLYWHTFYACDSAGRLLSRSEPFKLSPDHGIEFAAGLALGDRGLVAISYGTDDSESWIARTELSAVLGLLRKVAESTADVTPIDPKKTIGMRFGS
jgi:hypothetical protein